MSYPTAGFERAGAPTGAGSGFVVQRALAIGGQLLRVVFSVEPRHSSTAGLDDARNAANYQVTIVTGTGHALHSVAVKPIIVTYPAYGLFAAGECGCDLQLDRNMVVGMSYQVTVSPAVKSFDGEAIGTPYSATFVGAARPPAARKLRRKIGLVDLASDPFTGGPIIDSSGDWASHEGLDGTQKRVWRIAFTGLGKFIWLPNFGLKYDIKKPATLSILTGLRTDMRQQMAQQPDIVASETSASMNQLGYLALTLKGRTKTGEAFDSTAKFGPNGDIVL
ncbi:MAG TPA: hypothetical protein VMU34_04455 [Mycobacterium sp.]|nr:hypothetical protein [Mycobacterium sp.]